MRQFRIALLSLLFLYTVVGSFLVPFLLRPQIESFAKKELGVDLSIEELIVNPFSLSATLRNVDARTEDQLPLLSVQELYLNGSLASLIEQALTADKISIVAPTLHVALKPEYKVNFIPPLSKLVSLIEPYKKVPLYIREFELTGGALSLEDHMSETPISYGIQPLNGLFHELRSGSGGEEAEVELTFAVEDEGIVRVEGKGSIDTLQLELQIDGKELPVSILNRHLGLISDSSMKSGDASIESLIKVGIFEEGLSVNFSGDLAIDNFSADQSSHALTNFKNLSIAGITAEYPSLKLGIKEIKVDQADAYVEISRDGEFNIASLIEDFQQGFGFQQGKVKKGDLPKANSEVPPYSLTIDKIEFLNSSLIFADLSVVPPFKQEIKKASVLVRDIVSSGEPSPTELKASLGGYSPVSAKGQISPLAFQKKADLKLDVSNAELKNLTPYVAKFLGYSVDSGAASLRSNLSLVDRKFKAVSDIIIKDIELSDPPKGVEGTSLPVPLAVALMEDGDGKIQLDLPIEGNIDNPDFSIGVLVSGALDDVISQVVSAPFSILGGAFKEGTPSIEFQLGEEDMERSEMEKMNEIVALLKDKESVVLELRGIASYKLDGAVIGVDDNSPLKELATKRASRVKGAIAEIAPELQKRVTLLEPQLIDLDSSVQPDEDSLEDIRIEGAKLSLTTTDEFAKG